MDMQRKRKQGVEDMGQLWIERDAEQRLFRGWVHRDIACATRWVFGRVRLIFGI